MLAFELGYLLLDSLIFEKLAYDTFIFMFAKTVTFESAIEKFLKLATDQNFFLNILKRENLKQGIQSNCVLKMFK